jgi:hypothetical protein
VVPALGVPRRDSPRRIALYRAFAQRETEVLDASRVWGMCGTLRPMDHALAAALQRGFPFDDGLLLPWRTPFLQLKQTALPDTERDDPTHRRLLWMGRGFFGGLLYPVAANYAKLEPDVLDDIEAELPGHGDVAQANASFMQIVPHLVGKLGRAKEEQPGYVEWRSGGTFVSAFVASHEAGWKCAIRVTRRR